jgi:hypothetical protein
VPWNSECHILALHLGFTKKLCVSKNGLVISRVVHSRNHIYMHTNHYYNGFSTLINLGQPSCGFHKLQVFRWLKKNSHIFVHWRFWPKSC